MRSLPLRRSTNGGQPVPRPWCAQPLLRPPNTTYLLMVGQAPVFDTCMEQICLSRNPNSYSVRYLNTFNFNDMLAKLGLGSGFRDQWGAAATAGATAQNVSAQLPDLIQRFINTSLVEEGWTLGDGSYYDPCMDRQRVKWTYVAYGLFAAGILLVALDGIRKAFCCRAAPRQKGGWPTALVML